MEENTNYKMFGFTVKMNKANKIVKVEAKTMEEAEAKIEEIMNSEEFKGIKRYKILERVELPDMDPKEEIQRYKQSKEFESFVQRYTETMMEKLSSDESSIEKYKDGGVVFVYTLNGEIHISHGTVEEYSEYINNGLNCTVIGRFTLK